MSDDYRYEMNGFGDLTDDQVEGILRGTATSGEDLALASFLTDLRSLGTEPVAADLAGRQVPMLAEAVRLASSHTIAAQHAAERDLGTRARRENMFTTLKRRLATKAAAASFAAVLLGGGVAAAATGTLPAPAQEAVAELAEQVGIDLPNPAVAGQATAAQNQASAEEKAANAQAFAGAVQQTIGEYTTALDAWTACVADNASGRGTTQSDPATRTDEEFDPTEGCGPKPELAIPNPADFGLTGPDPSTGAEEDAGRPADAPDGPPEDAGPPADAPDGPPEDAGPPADLPDGPPEDAGPPADLP